jgi:hypothetical protein
MEEAGTIAKNAVAAQELFDNQHNIDVPNGYYNALRHSYWMAVAVYLGVSPYQATRFGIAHEEDGADLTPVPADQTVVWNGIDSNIDLNNNQVGAAAGMDVVNKDGEYKPFAADNPGLEDAYREIVDLIRTQGCDSGGCIDVSSQLP